MTTETEAAAAAEKDKTANQPPAEGAETAAEQDDIERLWSEAIAADEPAKPQETGKTEEEPHEKESASSESEENGKTAVAGDAPVAGDDKSKSEPAAPPPAEDIWAKASPELRAAHDAEMAALRKTANDAKAYAGRMRKQAEELKASAPREADKPGSKKVGDILKEGLAEYPEMAKPVSDALAPIEKQLERLDRFEASERALKQEEIDEHIRSQQRLLEAAHPGWEKEYIDGPNGKKFADWIRSPDRPVKYVKTVFETNNERIYDASAAIEVFDAFKASLTPTSTPPANDGGQTQELSAKRAAQLEGTRTPRTAGGAPRVSGIPKEGDPEAIWRAIPDDNADDRLLRGRRA